MLQSLLDKVKNYNENANFSLIIRAYNFAEKAHFNQLRESGEEHLQHLLNASMIIAGLKLDEISIAATLLHDVLEDTDTNKEKLVSEFGEEVANLVDGVTKISKITIPDYKSRQVENLRKMLIASTKDIRVILIKLADRLDNMSSLKYLREDKQKRIAQETIEVYAPIAYRLGLANIKWQLEDLAFRYLEPKIYQELKEKVSKKREERELLINKVKSLIEKEFRKRNLDFEIFGRVKHFYSIYKKIVYRNYELDKMYDLIALRIITNDIKECYEVLGIIHNMFKPVMDRFRDYIANPKSNMYQSLHTIVLVDDYPIEIQIRSKEMHRISEEGIAAHWQYKKLKSNEDFQKKLGLVQQILSIKDLSSQDFLEALKVDLFGDNIFVFTPKSDIIEVPKDATVLDFAYAVHTALGNSCVGARVNGKFVNIKYNLNNGDVVDVLTAKNQKPSRDWLKIVKSQRSRTKIMQTLRLHEIIPVSKLKKFEAVKDNIVVSDLKTNFIKLAKCCEPLPNDEIVGLSTRNNKITVHKKDCEQAKDNKIKKIKVEWNNERGLVVNVKVLAHDRIGLFADILSNVASLHINIEKADSHIINKDLAECNIKIKMNSLQDIIDVIDRVKKLSDVRKVSLN
ncbi:MAG: RelA/SpoT family protein [Nanoarchaeota archaeon]